MRSVLFWAMLGFGAPLLLLQGWFSRRAAVRLAPTLADGDCGCIGDGARQQRLWVIGESPAVGVGVDCADESVTLQFARELATRNGRMVRWAVNGMNGARCSDLVAALSGQGQELPSCADYVLVLAGANDATALTSIAHWRRNLGVLIELIRARGARRIVFAAVPPIRYFTLLPQPLRYVLGFRARLLDSAMRELVRDYAEVYVAADRYPKDPALLAPDGYHPNARACRQWVGELADELGL